MKIGPVRAELFREERQTWAS